jgi:hypothetical protein
VRDLTAGMNWPCEVVIASIREPSDFAGLPIVADGGVRFAPPRWARRLAAAGHDILFLDEISTALRRSRQRCCGWYSSAWWEACNSLLTSPWSRRPTRRSEPRMGRTCRSKET